MPEKSIDLSASFRGTFFQLQKSGEYDCAFVVHVGCPATCRLRFELHGEEVEVFTEATQEIINEYFPPSETTT